MTRNPSTFGVIPLTRAMHLPLVMRHASAADAAVLATFAAKAFSDTYRDLDDPKDIADYVSEHFNAQAISAVILDRTCTTLLATVGPCLAGYAVLAAGEPPGCITGPSPIELARFYLGTEFIGRGHGSQLMLAVHAEARRLAAATLWLGVYDRNVRAVQFYEHFGFMKVGGKAFSFGGRTYIDPIYSAPVRHDA